MNNQVNIHPLILGTILLLTGIAGASVSYFMWSTPSEPTDHKPSECPTYSPVGRAITEPTAENYYTNFVEQNGEEAVRYVTLSLDVLNDMNVVKQNADVSSIDLSAFKLYFGITENNPESFMMISGITGTGNLTKPIYKLVPNGEIGPCPHDCDAGSGLPPTH